MIAGITGVILAGGQGRRMGSVDKGLRELRGKAMVAWVLERFAPQVEEMLINANQNLDVYAKFGHRVIPDEIGGFAIRWSPPRRATRRFCPLIW